MKHLFSKKEKSEIAVNLLECDIWGPFLRRDYQYISWSVWSEEVRRTNHFDHGNWAERVAQWHRKDPKQHTNTCLCLLQLLRPGVLWYARRGWLQQGACRQLWFLLPGSWGAHSRCKAVWVCSGYVFPLTISPVWESQGCSGPCLSALFRLICRFLLKFKRTTPVKMKLSLVIWLLFRSGCFPVIMERSGEALLPSSVGARVAPCFGRGVTSVSEILDTHY